ncbi:MAG: DUF819 domain-containing protein [Parvicellaceae bacterium]|nr:DUF819 family protein [Flavobacteriales bacterium]|tara:strand:+ start:7720 stop:8958 length:1239 start_codon:yes stop_codon:yes gene_type:complete
MEKDVLITDDAVVLGLLVSCLGLIFYTSQLKSLKTFYKIIPALLLCYLIPSLFSTAGIISPKVSGLWPVAKNYFLPASLILMTLSTDLKGVIKLGPKALIMFFTATIGIIIGGPIAILITSLFSPETVGGLEFDAIWRGMATLAGSWIGGGANQTAMLELYQFNPEKYGAMITVDIVVANIWMAFILYGAGKSDKIDKWLKADSSTINDLKNKMENYSSAVERNTTFHDLMKISSIALGGVGIAHFLGSILSKCNNYFSIFNDTVFTSHFFWVVVVSTTLGLGLSFTRLRSLEGAGASKIGSVFIYLLVAIIGMKMDITKALEQPLLIVVGLIWMIFHVGLLVLVAKIIRAPFFFLAVGSKANVGGAASAPIVASAFHPSLAPVGVLLAVLGYALGTYGAILCATLMEIASP